MMKIKKSDMKETNKLLWAYLTLLVAALLLFSCSTTNKTKSVSKTNVDSSSVTHIDSSLVKKESNNAIKKDNSITTVEKEDNYTKETTIYFDTIHRVRYEYDTRPLYTTPAEDYFPVKMVVIKETGTKKEKIAIAANITDSVSSTVYDSSKLTKNVKTDYVKTEIVKDKNINRTSYWGWLWIALLFTGFTVLYFVGRYYGWWTIIFAFLKRRK